MENLAIIDKNTGKIVEERVLIIGKNPKYLDKGYIKVFTAFLGDLLETDKIAGKSIRLLFYMLEHLDYNTLEVKIIPNDAIKKLNITRMTYHRWIRDLIEFGIIEKKDRYTYILRPYSFVKGSHSKAIENEI
ncbi:MAG: replication/maintenance protein RepL, partial [Brevundimonas sp.]